MDAADILIVDFRIVPLIVENEILKQDPEGHLAAKSLRQKSQGGVWTTDRLSEFECAEANFGVVLEIG